MCYFFIFLVTDLRPIGWFFTGFPQQKPWCVCERGDTSSVPVKGVCHEIGPALRKIGSTDFVRMSKKDAFSW